MTPQRRRSRLRWTDTISESWLEASRRPTRAVMTGLGVALGAAVIVATLTLATTVRFQVSEEFDALLATQVELRVRGGGATAQVMDPAGEEGPRFPPRPDALERVAVLSGVEGVAVVRETLSDERIALSRVVDPTSAPARAPVRAVDAGALDALEARVEGPGWGRWHEDRRERVVLLGRVTANELGVHSVRPGDQVFINGLSFALAGIVDEVPRLPALRQGLVVPLTTDEVFGFDEGRDRVIVVVAPGAAHAVGEVLPLALDPGAPGAWSVYAAAGDDRLRRVIDSQLEVLALSLGGVVLLLGLVSIGNATLSSVVQRIQEIGLRRALGARPRHIAAHILLDAAIIGTTGGLLGATLGVTATLVITAVQGWQPVIDPSIPAATVVAGTLAGVLAGLYPARVGSRLEPTEALRRE